MDRAIIRYLVLLVWLTCPALGAIRKVPADYPTIQAAIDVSNNGDIVLVAPGTYTGDGNRDIDFKGKLSIGKSEVCNMKGFDSLVFLLCVILVLVSYDAQATADITIYVDTDVGVSGHTDGLSWEHAYNLLEEGLSRAKSLLKPVEIRVAQGIYKPGYPGHTAEEKRSKSFDLVNGITLKGGYAGFGENDPNDRNIRVYKTILSGDHNGDDIDLSRKYSLHDMPHRNDNSRWVVTISNADRTAVLDGFTIIGGYHNLAGRETPTGGAGLLVSRASPTVIDCTFIGNCVVDAGGAVYNLYCDSPIYIKCTFQNNYARSGGGMYNAGSNPTLVECVFVGNYAQYTGGGIGNSTSNPTLINCIFIGNIARNNVDGGGGMFNLASRPTINNCLFTGNFALVGAGISSNLSSKAKVNSCIYWNNVGPTVSGPVEIQYSNIQNGWTGEGNIDIDPLFVKLGYWADPNDPNQIAEPSDPNAVWIKGDYHLKSQAGRWDPNSQSWVKDDVTSPCIDAGDPNSPIGFEPFPNGGRINMGAYGGTAEASKSYFGEPVCETIVAGDINGDCKVDFADFAIMASHWLEDNSP